MKTINHYRVGILKSGENYFEKEKIGVALENEQWIILDVEDYDRITKDKSRHYAAPVINVPHIHKRDNETGYFADHKTMGNGVFYQLYSESEKRPSTIQKEIQKFLDEKFGYLGNIDLSFIK